MAKKYLLTGLGKGDYGGANTQVTEANLFKVEDDTITIGDVTGLQTSLDSKLSELPAGTHFGNVLFSAADGKVIVEAYNAADEESTTLDSRYRPKSKPIKVVSTSTYTLLKTDADKWLEFTNTNCTVTCPEMTVVLWSDVGIEFEGSFSGSGSLTFQGGTGVTIESVDNSKDIPQHGVFGIKYMGTTRPILFGTLI